MRQILKYREAEAYDEGREEGKFEEKKKNLIKNLYEAKFTVAEISKLLKTKEDEVEKDYKLLVKGADRKLISSLFIHVSGNNWGLICNKSVGESVKYFV